MWVPAFACLACRATVPDVPGVCATCGARYAIRDGILRFASDERLSEFAAFLTQYLAVRHADGHVPGTADEYRALPRVSRSHPAAVEWRIRRRSLETLQRLSLGTARPMRVLDLGAGNGWLSHQIARRGHDAVAVDLNDDAGDGLAACRAYAAP
ncbi:MAG TPA: hypothetical protein VM032_08060, partial [Vicinamibacterales bacterium]|nr:hypothetical protein [Vicinamibacterales bacterium]